MLDSYQNDTYPDGQAAAVYGQYPPLVNACRPPGEWQAYDIVFRRPRFRPDGGLVSPARITVIHNGILVQDDVEPWGPTSWLQALPYTAHADKLPLGFQDHGNPVRYRNVWLRELPETLAPGPPEDARPVVNLSRRGPRQVRRQVPRRRRGEPVVHGVAHGPSALLQLLLQRAAARARRPLGEGRSRCAGPRGTWTST